MATIQGTDQITITDISDGYTVVLSNESHTFVGGTDAAEAGSATTNVYVYRGGKLVPFAFGTISGKTGITPSGSVNSSTNVGTVTFTVTSALKSGGTIDIPINITGTEISIIKQFSYGIAFTGAKGADADPLTITDTSVTYQTGSSGTTKPTGAWSETVPTVSAGQYLWTKTWVEYSDGTETESYAVSYKAVDGTDADPLTITTKTITYQVGSSGTTAPTSTWSSTVPSVAQGKFLWTKTYIKYSDGTETVSYAVSYNAVDGEDGYTPVKGVDYDDGAPAFAISITTSDGNIFKNNTGSTTLTANVFLGGVQLDEDEIAKYGTLHWYKTDDDENFAPVGTGQSITVSASAIDNRAVYTVQLEE